MIYLFIIFLPTLIVMGQMMQFHYRRKRWIPLLTLPASVFAIMLNAFVQLYEYEVGLEATDTIVIVRNIIVSLVVPLIYVFLRSKSGEKVICMSLICITALSALNFLGGMTLYMDKTWIKPFPAENYLHIVNNGKEVFNMEILELIMLLQLLTILIWGITFYKKMQKQNLHFSKKSKRLGEVICALIVIGALSIFIPNNVWFSSIWVPLGLYFIISVFLTLTEYLVSQGWILAPILDANNEPAVNTISIDENILETNIRRYIEEEKAYLNSNLRIEDVARKLATNRTYISKAINRMTGFNFNTYLNKLRIKAAIEMIEKDPNMPLEIVAEKCGFNTASAFTKVFKKETGITPKEKKKDCSRVLQ